MLHIPTSHSEGLYYYMIFYLAAILIGIGGAILPARSKNITFKEFSIVVSTGILSLLIGSKLIVFEPAQWQILFGEGRLPIENGKSVLGALLGGIIGVWGAGKLLGIKVSLLDLFAVSFPLGMAVQRIGCLLAGCCHGIPTSQNWGITYGLSSTLYAEQIQQGILHIDATRTLAVHPNQIYNIIVCSLIAFIVWRTCSRWKSKGGKFLFFSILYLGFRFIEEFTRFSIEPHEWMGLKMVQWKVLILSILLAVLLYYRERKSIPLILPEASTQLIGLFPRLKMLLFSLILLIVTIQTGDWLTVDERTIVVYTIFPLLGLVILENSIHIFLSQKIIKIFSLTIFAVILMSQKSHQPIKTPVSYTSFNFTTAFGKFNLNHKFNHQVDAETYTNCDGNQSSYGTDSWDVIPYKHTYEVGGIGISRKKYYNQWRSSLISLNLFMGQEKEGPTNYFDDSFNPPRFTNILWGINPMVQYDGRGIGLGLGVSLGILGFDDKKSKDLQRFNDYDPKFYKRTSALQTRLRLLNERYFFLEMLGGYEAGAIGDNYWQILVGSRFNTTDKYLLKVGVIGVSGTKQSFVLQGQLPLFSNFYLSPGLILYEDNYYNKKSGYRAVIGLEYRLQDKLKGN